MLSTQGPNVPAQPGTYALVLVSTRDEEIRVGRLGRCRVAPGFYVYVGTAFGPGGLKGRISHHRQRASRPRWHVDYLRAVASLREIWYTCDPLRREHQWAETLNRAWNASVPAPGFGSSDCRCESHLFFFRMRPSVRAFRRRIHSVLEGHGRICTVEWKHGERVAGR